MDRQADMTLRQRALKLLKNAWLIGLFGVVLLYLASNLGDAVQQLARLNAAQIIVSVGLLLLGRLLLFEHARRALLSAAHPLPYRAFFPVIALAHLTRYLPGGIWHFVGQGAYYRAQGVPLARVGRVLLLENLWLLLSSGLFASALLILAQTPDGVWALLLWPLVWVLLLRLLAQVLTQRIGWRFSLRLMGLQALMWLAFGASFALLLPAVDALLLMGAFVAAWLVGFVTVFAPGGLGTREATLVIILLAVLPANETFVLALVHRLLWVSAELLLGLLAVWVRRANNARAIKTS